MNDNFFIEIDSRQVSENGRLVSGDVFLSGKRGDKVAFVLSDGAGSGTRTNIIATTIASMALNYTLADEDPVRAAKSIVETFARGDKSNDVKQATFTVVSINKDSEVTIVEFENPDVIITRGNKIIEISKKKCSFITENKIELTIYLTKFNAKSEDRIVLFTDGITLSGLATRRMPLGWKREGVIEMVSETLSKNPYISAVELSQMVVSKSEMNDLFIPKNDSCCASVYFRKPRKILVCTGPPYNADKDSELVRKVVEYDGDVIISGGTTAKIVARETNRDMTIIMKRDPSRLPPIAKMEGTLMVTEGVLTLAKVKSLLENIKNSDIRQNGIDAQYAKHLLGHDHIEFLVGTRINAVHQDPNLPVELELRRSVVKDICRVLENRFMKKVIIHYI